MMFKVVFRFTVCVRKSVAMWAFDFLLQQHYMLWHDGLSSDERNRKVKHVFEQLSYALCFSRLEKKQSRDGAHDAATNGAPS